MSFSDNPSVQIIYTNFCVMKISSQVDNIFLWQITIDDAHLASQGEGGEGKDHWREDSKFGGGS